LAYQKEGVPLYLNADHTYSTDLVQRAISAGVDSVVVDGAKLPFEDNAELLKLCVKYARASGRDVVIEGELGYIGTSSSVMESLPAGVSLENLTTPEDAKRLVLETGIDCLAPAIGNVHGMLKNAKEPRLHPERVKEIANAVTVPLVLHGASGNTDEDVRACITAGITVVHINTELRVAYHDALKDTLEKSAETTPYKFLSPAEQKMKEFLIQKIQLFANP
jgi:fructose-bisphosphate aldolase class II